MMKTPEETATSSFCIVQPMGYDHACVLGAHPEQNEKAWVIRAFVVYTW